MVDPYVQPGYLAHVAAGDCPAISNSKSWCSRTAGHIGPHSSPFLEFGGHYSEIEWTEVLPRTRYCPACGEKPVAPNTQLCSECFSLAASVTEVDEIAWGLP